MKKSIMILVICLFIDQLIKNIIINVLSIGESISIIKNFFSITYVRNSGAAFSILESNTILLIIISVCALIFIFKYISKDNLSNFECLLYGLLSGGICGNLFDRIVYKSVIDYLDFNIFGYKFPIFNFADILIVVSMFLIIITMKDDKNEV
ncbi:MAG: signal peptidase II [Bacilli bacterium]|nr:signal peptidase II [Bacilli bacterium]